MNTTTIAALKKAAAAVAVAVALAGGAAAQQHEAAAAFQASLSRIGLDELEQAFWTCDYVATVHGAGDDKIVACSAVYDALKERKFSGDFDRLVVWWERNKPAQFARLAARDTPRR